MKYLKVNELREIFLKFFEERNHLRLNSFSLVPNNDNSLLLINSGMAPMKNYFTGSEKPPSKRVVTCQKCIRTQDIELVGLTSRHGTFFEMLGNFSFGDYFKEEAISLAFSFLTEYVEIPKEKLFISIYEEDDEALEVWSKLINRSKIVKLGKENFWEHGKGPCGPCSEIYYDRGEEYGCGSEDCTVGCDCDRYLEIWNLVFTGFYNDGNGNYEKLKSVNIDTGMGLERLAFLCQGVDNFFLIDTTKEILDYVLKLCGKTYGEDQKVDTSARIITDHIRSAVFMASDGMVPSNEGRGYIMRKLLRRAIRHGRLLGFEEPFLHKVCDVVIKQNKSAYADLSSNTFFIKERIYSEEESFSKTLEQGTNMLNSIIKEAPSKKLSASDVFLLYDTYGFPIDITREILKEKGFGFDEDGFEELVEEQRKKSGDKKTTSEAFGEDSLFFKEDFSTEFLGHDSLSCMSRVLGIFKDGVSVKNASVNEEISLILDKTVFYPEGGGQVSDQGEIYGRGGTHVFSVKKVRGVVVHVCKVDCGSLNVGDEVELKVDRLLRKNIARNHTAAHLLHAVLRKRWLDGGNRVRQAGQLVTDKGIRFDFTYPYKLDWAEDIAQIEHHVNLRILEDIKVETSEMSIDEAKKLGATALFDEKYGDTVRVVNIPGISMELCSGAHVTNTSDICLFKIVSETSVSSGVRRIEAVTGEGLLRLLDEYERVTKYSSYLLKSPDVVDSIKKLLKERKINSNKLEALESKFLLFEENRLLDSKKTLDFNVSFICDDFKDLSVKSLRVLCDRIKDKLSSCVCVFSNTTDDKTSLMVCVGKEAERLGLNSGILVNSLAKLADGKGGGRGSIATAGIGSREKLSLVFENAENIIKSMIKRVKI